MTGAQVQVIGVSQNYLGFDVIFQIPWSKCFNGGTGTHGHEDRRFDISMRSM
jgi:hypothetical protein